MSTAGGPVFGGSEEGNFFALDTTDRKPLWQFQARAFAEAGRSSQAIATYAQLLKGLPQLVDEDGVRPVVRWRRIR
jgi:outer membrane protein assembly factor BamB